MPVDNVNDQATQSNDSMASSSPAKDSMKGRVEHLGLPASTELTESPKQAAETIKLNLKKVSDSTRRLQEALRGIVYEITQRQQVTVAQPNVIGSMVVPGIPGGAIPIGDYLPPNQRNMTVLASQTQRALTILIEQSSTLPSSDAADDQLNGRLSLIKSDLDYLRERNQALQASMASPPYENLAIGRIVVAMSDRLDRVKKSLKEAERRIGKDIKRDARK